MRIPKMHQVPGYNSVVIPAHVYDLALFESLSRSSEADLFVGTPPGGMKAIRHGMTSIDRSF